MQLSYKYSGRAIYILVMKKMCSVFVFLIFATCRVSSAGHQSTMHDHGRYPERTITYKYGNVYSPQETTTYMYDHVVYPEESTPKSYDYGMISEPAKTRLTKPYRYNHREYPEWTTTNTYGYGFHQGLTTTSRYDYSMYPEERTKTSKNGYGLYYEGKITTLIKGNDEHPDWTKTSKNDIDNYLEMTTAYLYDDGQTAEGKAFDESNNCSRLIPEPIGLFNKSYLQGLQDCVKGTVVRKLLCSHSVTYNISFVNDVVPYFSDLQIYFADGINNCTNRFNKFIESKHNILTNLEIFHFLTRSSTCWEYTFFTYQLCVNFKLNTDNKRLSLNVRTFPYESIHLTLKHQSCRNEFIQHVYENGLHMSSNDTYILNIDKINNFSKENNCLDIHFPCPWPAFTDFSLKVPESTTTVYMQLVIAVEVILVNSVVVFVFLQLENRTPVTILLSALAVSDSSAAVLMTFPIFTAHQIYGNRIYEHSLLYILGFPDCVYNFLYIILRDVFHMTSVLITTLLCLEKTAALLFPFWTKQHINNRINIVCSLLMFIMSMSLFSRFVYEESLVIYNLNGRCCLSSQNIDYQAISYHYIIVNAFILLACLVVFLCTVYMICKLTILRRNLPWTDSPVVQKRNRISAITVVFICIIFLLSELPFIYTSFIYMIIHVNFSSLTRSALDDYVTFFEYKDLGLIIGFSLNFLVYIIMSKQILNKLWISVMKFAGRCKCW